MQYYHTDKRGRNDRIRNWATFDAQYINFLIRDNIALTREKNFHNGEVRSSVNPLHQKQSHNWVKLTETPILGLWTFAEVRHQIEKNLFKKNH